MKQFTSLRVVKFRLLVATLLIATLSSCTTSNTHALRLEHIGVDNNNPNSIKQITFQFNQPVTYLGGVPSPAQIDAVNITPSLKEQCRWRFVKLNILACELSHDLAPLSEYNIGISASFSALGKTLSNELDSQPQRTILTTLPNIPLSISAHNKDFPIEFSASQYFNANSSGTQHKALYLSILKAIRLKGPDGALHTPKLHIDTNDVRQLRWRLNIESFAQYAKPGHYQIVLPEGFTPAEYETQEAQITASHKYRSLKNDESLLWFNYQNAFVFYGVQCAANSGPKDEAINLVQTNAQGKLDCPPENISLAFSRPLQETSEHPPLKTWLQGPSFTAHSPHRSNNVYYYPLELQGSSEYKLLLADLISKGGGKLSSLEPFTFSTHEATDYWRFENSRFSVIETQKASLPYIFRRNTPQLTQTFKTIASPQALLEYLNGNSQEGVTSPLAPTDQTRTKQGVQYLDIRNVLDDESGLVLASLKGRSMSNAPPFYRNTSEAHGNMREVDEREDARLFNSAAFNLAVVNNNSLLIQAIDWQANMLSNAHVQLVCKKQNTLIELGTTNEGGLLLLDYTQWAKTHASLASNNCWIWAEHSIGSAAIALPEQHVLPQKQIIAHAYTAQPIYEAGDTVHIGVLAKQRSFNTDSIVSTLDGLASDQLPPNKLAPLALKPIENLAQYSLVISAPKSSETLVQLPLTEVSSNGLAHGEFVLPSNARPGWYTINLKANSKQSGETSNTLVDIGTIQVLEFTPPEFEQTLKLSSQSSSNGNEQDTVYFGETFKAQINANRLNGQALHNAIITTRYQVKYSNKVPQHWPENYQFSSWDEYRAQNKKAQPIEQVNKVSDGSLSLKSSKISSTMPIGKIEFSSEVSADDGETQVANQSLMYLSRDHYIGTKISKDKTELQLLAVDNKGQTLTNLLSHVTFYQQDEFSEFEKWQVLSECEVVTLPSSCQIPKSKSTLKIEIVSGEQQYQSIRKHYPNPGNPLPGNSSDAPKEPYLDLRYISKAGEANSSHNSIKAKVDDLIHLEVDTNAAGLATFVIHSGTIQKVWQQKLAEGKQSIALRIDANWFPYAQLNVTLAPSRSRINNSENALADAQQRQDLTRPYPKNKNDYRFLKSTVDINVLPKAIKPELLLKTNTQALEAGGKVTLDLTANTPMQSQLWLVNDGILALSNTTVDNYNFNDYFKYLVQAQTWWYWESLNTSLITNTPFSMNEAEQESFALSADVSGTRMRASSPQEPYQKQGSSQFSRKDFAQSVWLGTLNLEADKRTKLTADLPQLIGRWKVIAINTTAQQQSVSQLDITTSKAVEYLLDAPTDILSTDKPSIAITQINNSPRAVEDLLTLAIKPMGENTNGTDSHSVKQTEVVEQWQVKLPKQSQKDSYQRKTYTLPALATGKYSLLLSSKADPNFAAYSELRVLSGAYETKKTWFVEPQSNQATIMLEANIDTNDIVFTHSPSGTNAPNWQLINEYNQTLKERNWEQILSSAITYAYSPKAQEQWPQGHKKLANLLGNHALYTSYNGSFRYYPQTQNSDFLSAYTALAYSWLENSSLPLKVNIDKLLASLTKLLEQETQSNNTLAQSMALLALASNQAISLEQALEFIQKMGALDKQQNHAKLLQALSMKLLGAEQEQYNAIIRGLYKQQYIDTFSSVFNQTSYQCFAALAFKDTPEFAADYANTIKEVVTKQHANGHFGSTFANGICSYVLHKNKVSGALNPIEFTLLQSTGVKPNSSKHSVNITSANNRGFWLHGNFTQPLSSAEPSASGAQIKRHIEVLKDKQWLEQSKANLQVGDLVRTRLIIHSPVARHHVSVSDNIAGGFEALQPSFKNMHYQASYSRNWFSYNRLSISQGQASWYLQYLPAGSYELMYYARVRHSGEYSIAPAELKAVYREDIFASTAAAKVSLAE